MIELSEIDEADLPRWVAVASAVQPRDKATVEGHLDWRRQADDTVWLLATLDGVDAGAGIGVHGWHAPPGIVRTLAYVLDDARARGVGSKLLSRLDEWALAHGAHSVEGSVAEDDPRSIAWLERRGYVEVGRNSTMVLDLTSVDAPPIAPPEGIEIVTWADRPELATGMYEVACEAYPDVPGEEETEMSSFEDWRSNDMEGSSDRPEATFVALAGEHVVGYAKLTVTSGDSERAGHDITAVLRAWRGRGIAGALKRAEIAWAKRSGYTRLETMNEMRNEPIRRLNERHGYVLEPGVVVVRRSLPETG